MPEQLILDLPVRVSRTRGDFFLSEANALAVARLDAPETWPNGKLVLIGPEGSGKSHLAEIWAESHSAEQMDLPDIPARDIPAIASACVIEIGDEYHADPAEEEALFHLHNHLAGRGLPLLLVARRAPARWNVALPDLKSRMQAADIAQIDAPDDALLSAVLLKLFADRQLAVPPALIGWLTARMERSFAAAQHLVTLLDETAMAEARPITQALARRVLEKLGTEVQ